MNLQAVILSLRPDVSARTGGRQPAAQCQELEGGANPSHLIIRHPRPGASTARTGTIVIVWYDAQARLLV